MSSMFIYLCDRPYKFIYFSKDLSHEGADNLPEVELIGRLNF